MGRTPKKGVDYFPHDTDASTRMTVRALERKFGNDGYAAWFKLLETLGRTETLFIDCSGLEERIYLADNMGLTEDKAKIILDFLADTNAIDAELWRERKIIWSQNFADRLAALFKKRVGAAPQRPSIDGKENPQPEIRRPEETASKPQREPIRREPDLPPPGPQIDEEDDADDGPFGLSMKDIAAAQERDEAIETAARKYGLPCHEGNMIQARDLAEKYSLEWLIKAVERSGDGPEQTWRYVKGILKRWKDQGFADEPGGGKQKMRQQEQQADQSALEMWGGSL